MQTVPSPERNLQEPQVQAEPEGSVEPEPDVSPDSGEDTAPDDHGNSLDEREHQPNEDTELTRDEGGVPARRNPPRQRRLPSRYR